MLKRTTIIGWILLVVIPVGCLVGGGLRSHETFLSNTTEHPLAVAIETSGSGTASKQVSVRVDVKESSDPTKMKVDGTWPEEHRSCELCHVTKDRYSKHDLSKPIPQLCYECHETYSAAKYQYLHGPVAVGACLICHDPHRSLYRYLQKVQQPTYVFNATKQEISTHPKPIRMHQVGYAPNAMIRMRARINDYSGSDCERLMRCLLE